MHIFYKIDFSSKGFRKNGKDLVDQCDLISHAYILYQKSYYLRFIIYCSLPLSDESFHHHDINLENTSLAKFLLFKTYLHHTEV